MGVVDHVVTRTALVSLIGMAHALQFGPRGCFVEVGVYKGGSAQYLSIVAERQGRQLHLFDTFSGMPVSGPLDGHPIGDFSDTSAAAVQALIPRAILHPGTFPQTMPADLPPIAFAHIDCDQYESIKACIDHLFPRLAPGGVMLFDDYEYFEGARLAVDEQLKDLMQVNHYGKVYVQR